VCGGDSSELEVSFKSAEGLYSFIDKTQYRPWIVVVRKNDWHVKLDGDKISVIDMNDFSFRIDGEKILFDFAWITIHGTPGENGLLQGYFDLIGLPYSCCGVLAAALTFNKFVCNQYLKNFGVMVAESIMLRRGQTISSDELVAKLGLPCFIKSNVGGSSFGTSKVKVPEEIQPAIEKSFIEGDEVIAESFLSGTEVTCGCYKTSKVTRLLPVTEVVSDNEFFDFEAKYKGQVKEITPARISDDVRDRIHQITSMIYDIVGCKGIIRSDYIITENGINLLEVNTTPGMTETSFIPQQVSVAGLTMASVMQEIIEDSFR
jgi:D-alanine-D-alanine ligase